MIYLYVKRHAVTGLMYFGKTANGRDPYTYIGSGKRWLRHCDKHGRDHVETTNVWEFDNEEACNEFATNFSIENNIVKSTEWANLRIENGLDGKPVGSPGLAGELNPMYGRTHSVEARAKIVAARKARGPISEEHRAKLRAAIFRRGSPNKGNKMSSDTRARMAASQSGKPWWNNGISEKKSATQPDHDWIRGRLKRT